MLSLFLALGQPVRDVFRSEDERVTKALIPHLALSLCHYHAPCPEAVPVAAWSEQCESIQTSNRKSHSHLNISLHAGVLWHTDGP